MDKYYTPEESDLYVGYQCQWHDCEYPSWSDITLERGWRNTNEDNDIYDYWDIGNIRTKYLDKEDIESLGWIQHATMPEVFFREDNPLGILYLELRDNNIIRIENDRTSEYLFQGKAKSINEFKKIMEWVL